MTVSPQFSPAMLRLFLKARGEQAAFGLDGAGRARVRGKEMKRIRKSAGVTHRDLEKARTGRLTLAAPRVRIWAALGLVPAAAGVMLTDDGGQEVFPVLTGAPQPTGCCPADGAPDNRRAALAASASPEGAP